MPKNNYKHFMHAKVKHLCPQTQYDQRSKRRSSKSNKGVLIVYAGMLKMRIAYT